MICFQRGAYEAVPGCLGGKEDDSALDYCVPRSSGGGSGSGGGGGGGGGGSPNPPTKLTRLKLYWEPGKRYHQLSSWKTYANIFQLTPTSIVWNKGYYWQEETRERKCKKCLGA